MRMRGTIKSIIEFLFLFLYHFYKNERNNQTIKFLFIILIHSNLVPSYGMLRISSSIYQKLKIKNFKKKIIPKAADQFQIPSMLGQAKK